GEIQSPFGHKRRFYIIPADESGRLHVVKEGINFLPQNIAASITNWAFCDLVEYLVSNDMWYIAQPRINGHDAIVINVKQDHIEEIGSLTKGFMERAAKDAIGWEFPYVAEISVGPTWGDLKEIEL